MADSADQKSHHKSSAGPKADRKKSKKLVKKGDISQKGKNPKAFGFQSGVAAAKTLRRNLDRENKRLHVPLIDRTSSLPEPPPFVVVVVGPPKTGKSTLIRSLVKHYTKQNVTDIKGPITVVTGKHRRVTFYECANELNAMIDLAKIADLVLLLVDAAFGFEMETFEFLNILQVHGFPKVMGVLTHLDKFKHVKQLRRTRKKLKTRFWTEICDGAKVFYLSGLVNGKYHPREVLNLSRFISVMKFRPIQWRNTHSFVLADRFEDVTDPEKVRVEPNCDRRIVLFGYVRGTYLRPTQRIHIPGAGDFSMDRVVAIEDPCMLPDQIKRRSLNQKERRIYAPMSDMGELAFDQDAVYIQMDDSKVRFSEAQGIGKTGDNGGDRNGDSVTSYHDHNNDDNNNDDDDEEFVLEFEDVQKEEQIVRKLQNLPKTIDEELDEVDLRLFSDAKNPIRIRRRAEFDDGLSDDDAESGDDVSDDGDEAGDEDEDEDEDGDRDGDRDVSVSVDAGRPRKLLRRGNGHEDDDEDEYDGKEELAYADTDSELEEDEDGVEDGDDDDDDDDEADDGTVDDAEADEGGEEEEEEKRNLQWKEKMHQQAADRFSRAKKKKIEELIYGSDSDALVGSESDSDTENEPLVKKTSLFGDHDSDDDGDLLRKKKMEKGDRPDRTRAYSGIPVLDKRFVAEILKNTRFADDGEEDAPMSRVLSSGDASGSMADLIEQLKVRFILDREDEFHTREKSKALKEPKSAEEDSESLEDGSDAENEEDSDAENDKIDRELEGVAGKEAEQQDTVSRLLDEVMVDGTPFLDSINDAKKKQQDINLTQGMDLRSGFHPGIYVRIEIHNVPCEFTTNFHAQRPIIAGGLLPNEERLGFLQVRLKKHRWHKKILKTNDPLVFSIGWRRFQSIPLFCMKDPARRHRLLKYTPEHMHCMATFYGPLTPPNTGFLAIQNISTTSGFKQASFRISATGTVLENDESFTIVKKLKLTGVPQKILKNTAYIQNMFNSALEASKFVGASIRTVSGIRGQIKKVHKEQGVYRATFEDKILMSDIIFLKTWYPVQARRLYNPVYSLLMNKFEDTMMKTVGQLRRDKQIPLTVNRDSEYREIVRTKKVFAPLRIPNSLQEQLPFKTKPKLDKKQKHKSYETRRAVVLEPEEKKTNFLLQQLAALRNDKEAKRKQQKKVERAEFLQKKADEADKKAERVREAKKRTIEEIARKGRVAKRQRMS
eukprot:ANDGO_05255.mRNA.1 Ribosome biogenesis protein bms1